MKYKKMKEIEINEKKVRQYEDNAGAFVDLLNKEMDSLIKSYKCGDCVHLPLCMAQKGGVNLGLASENDCMYFQRKLPENAVVLTEEEYERLLACEHNLNVGRESYRRMEERAYKTIEELNQQLKQERKETAREILKKLKAKQVICSPEEDNFVYMLDIKELAKQYGVEIEE